MFSTSNKSYFEKNLIFLQKNTKQLVTLDPFGLWGTHSSIGTGRLSN